MVERRETISIPDQNIIPVNKAVVILFPDVRTTGGKNLQPGHIPALYQDFRDTTNKLLTLYKREGFRNLAVIYRDTSPETFSYFYPQNQFQDVVRWEDFGSWGDNQNFAQSYEKDLPQLLKSLNLKEKAEVVVGGYHAKDCVAKFTAFLRSEGFRAKPDLRLTEELPFLLISHRLRKMLPPGEMRSDHAKEDKLIWQAMKETEEEIIIEMIG